MSEDQVRTWVEDAGAVKEGRAALFSKSGYAKMISKGVVEEPPSPEY
jgi:hypothetical protein